MPMRTIDRGVVRSCRNGVVQLGYKCDLRAETAEKMRKHMGAKPVVYIQHPMDHESAELSGAWLQHDTR